MKKSISTGGHGVLDHVVGGALLAAPEVLGLNRVPASAAAARVVGASHLTSSLFTDYELSPLRPLPMRVHPAVDALGGVALAAAPWLAGFAGFGKRYWLPYVLIGLNELSVVAPSCSTPSYERSGVPSAVDRLRGNRRQARLFVRVVTPPRGRSPSRVPKTRSRPTSADSDVCRTASRRSSPRPLSCNLSPARPAASPTPVPCRS